jgi:hypothetical protein
LMMPSSNPEFRPSQRHLKRRQPAPPPRFQVGDTVKWNGRYRGVIRQIFAADSTALVEDDGSILGNRRKWRLDLAALSPA